MSDAQPRGRLRVLDVCAGAGGASEGLRRAGLRPALAIDNDPWALLSHQANHPDTEHLLADISTLDPSTLGRFDVVWGSPPCMEFSSANRANGPLDTEEGMRLVRAFLGIVEAVRPRWWVMENVPGVMEHVGASVPRWIVLNAADYGVPQTRVRAFGGRFPTPRPTHDEAGPPSADGRWWACPACGRPGIPVRDVRGIIRGVMQCGGRGCRVLRFSVGSF